MSIEIKHLSKQFGTQKALDDISFSVKSGEIVGFIGPNGAGKSTTMKILTGFINNFKGEATVDGLNVKKDSRQVKNITGYLPEHNPLYLDQYVKEYLRFVADIYSLDNKTKRISEVIEMTGLGPEEHKVIGALSKGYRQRVGLAAAIIHDPRFLILDEPTTGLDPNQIVSIRNLIASLGKEKTVILSTHIMQEVEAICDRVVIINKGKIVVDDKAGNVKKYSDDSSTTILVEFSGKIDKEGLGAVPGITKLQELDGNKWIIQSSSDIRKQVFDLSVKKELAILSMQIQEKNLEDLFRELTS